MWSSCFELLFIRDPPSIKAALFLYYTSVLILTKIIDHLLPLEISIIPTERSYEIEGPRLSAGATHKLKPSPSAWPESWNIHIPLRDTSYIPDSIPNPCVDQFLIHGLLVSSVEYLHMALKAM